ncbi:penicillin-binding transpeptidase domain-containing protein [uncultured Selenomonas sp.]|uniref:peptidoglycan D,D-transpeptidase FtsI family protein n=1 Tax=uncultured Selenomonas sp. TaxID=159275 RepID=UPI0028D3F264|nr:penicillin-binding transpeptidase domain-containing protein [uncultured Selenomonas sp.]
MADHSIRRQIAAAAAVLLILFAVQILYLTKIAVWDGAALAQHPLNMRTALAEKDIRRGRILDRTGEVLAVSNAAGVRSYPYGAALAPVTGYQTERYGASGIEQAAGAALGGMTADMVQMGPVRTLLRSDTGYDVRLTVDAALSGTAWHALGGRRGAVVVMDAATGAVLTMVSAPSVSPAAVEQHWEEYGARTDSPLLNRALQGLYPPGSTFKPLIADAALESGATNPDEVFTCTGSLAVGTDYVLHESHGAVHGQLRLADALRESCNTTFASLALRLGARGLTKAFDRFGLDVAIDTPEVPMAAAHIPALTQLSDGDIAQLGIGQGQLLVTPMQMVLIADAFANEGRVMQPYLVDAVLTDAGTPLYETRPAVWRTVTTPVRAAIIDSYMESVVTHGTGTAAAVHGVRVTGKTGTAENTTGADHAWFIGAAERGGRKIVMAVLVEEGGFGGRAAAGIARQIITSYFEGETLLQ